MQYTFKEPESNYKYGFAEIRIKDKGCRGY